jgi:4-hydroxybenzoate polyprenyltransferase
LLVFAGIVFAAKLGDAIRWAETIGAFAAYCALSSAAYLVNDVRDREHDRLHPVKRERPVARGELSAKPAVGLAAALSAGALGQRMSLAVLAALSCVDRCDVVRILLSPLTHGVGMAASTPGVEPVP